MTLDAALPGEVEAGSAHDSPCGTVADALVDALRDWGVRQLFGVSGANIEHLHDAVHRRGGDRLASVLTTREDAGAFMADAQARLDGRLGVCCSTSGGAMLNLVAGLGESLADGVGVLALVGHPPTDLDGRGGFQEATGRPGTVDADGLLRAVTKATIRVPTGEQLWPALRSVVTTALSGRPGPAALLLPRDVFDQAPGPRPVDWPAEPGDLRHCPLPTAEHLDRLHAALRNARRPLIVLGPEGRRGPRPDAVLRFARRTGTPVAATIAGLEGLETELDAGVFGALGHPSVDRLLTDEIDLVVVAGSGLDAMWRGPLERHPDVPVAVIAHDTTVARTTLAPWWWADGDAGEVFHELGRLAATDPHRAAPGSLTVVERVPGTAVSPADRRPHPRGDGTAMTASAAAQVLQRRYPEGGHVLYDAGDCVSVVLHSTRLPVGTRGSVAFGMGGMGYSIPAAVGTALAAPGKRVMVVCGDGSFLMNGLEMLTAVAERLPVLTVVLNNQMHGMCAVRQEAMFDTRHEAVAHASVDVGAVARGLGPAGALWIGSTGDAGELEELLAAWYAHSGPGVLEVRIGEEEIPPGMAFSDRDAPLRPRA